MILLNQGQRPLLEFLRNLTSQVLVGTTAVLLWAHLDFGRFDLSNWAATLSFFLAAALFGFAFYANMNQFIDTLLDSLGNNGRLARRLRRRGVKHSYAAWATLRFTARRRPSLILDFVASVAIVNVALLAVVLAIASAAKTALR